MSLKSKIIYSNHAVSQMFQRGISTNDVEYTITKGKVIKQYPDDKPYPSKIILAFKNNRPLHIVYSYNEKEDTFIIITAYEPNTEIWENDYKTRKK